MIKRIKERSRHVDPSPFLMIENCGDTTQFVYANLTGMAMRMMSSLYIEAHFSRVHSGEHDQPRRIDDRNLRYAWFYRDRRAFVLGSVFWMELGDRFGPGNEELLESAREALRLRQLAAPYIARGRYRDDVGLAVIGDHDAVPDWEPKAWWNGEDESALAGDCDWGSLPFKDLTSITASRWTLVSEGVLVLISNPQEAPGRRIWVEGNFDENRLRGRKLHAVSYTLGGARSDSSVAMDEKGGVTLRFPHRGFLSSQCCLKRWL